MIGAASRAGLESAEADAVADTVRVGGLGALLSGIVFLGTIAYTFGFLFARGLSLEMLNVPARLLPWIHANTVAYVGLWWIYTLHFLCLLPAPRGLAVIAGDDGARIRMATVAGIAGAVVGTIAAQVNIATAPPLAAASVASAPALLPGVWLQSELAGGLGLPAVEDLVADLGGPLLLELQTDRLRVVLSPVPKTGSRPGGSRSRPSASFAPCRARIAAELRRCGRQWR
jgi:hypothetical protein